MLTADPREPATRDRHIEYGMKFLQAPLYAFTRRLNPDAGARDLPTGTPRFVAERALVRWSLRQYRWPSIDSGPA